MNERTYCIVSTLSICVWHTKLKYYCIVLYCIVLHTVSQKLDPFSFEHNFRKYCPILIIFSPLQRLTDDVAQIVACSIVASRLDYCNTLLSGAPAATFDKLQRPQNNLARVVCQSTDARPLLHSLHWLPVRQRVTYKLAVLTHKVRTTATPTYLSELVQTRAPPRVLRSSDTPMLVVPRIHTELARRAFFCCCSIHLELSTCWDSTVRKHSHFQTPLKTYLFKLT